MIYCSRRRNNLDLRFQVERGLGVIREQEVVKNEEDPAQSPARSLDQFVREHYPWIVYPKEVGQLVRGRYQSVRGRDVNLSRTVSMTGGVC